SRKFSDCRRDRRKTQSLYRMMLQHATDNRVRTPRTAAETGVALASRLRNVLESVRLADAPTLPCACSSRARYELPSVRNLGPPQLRICAAGTARRGRNPTDCRKCAEL